MINNPDYLKKIKMSKTKGILYYRGDDKELIERPDWNELSEDEKKQLGLKVEPISTQIIPRDRHAFYFSVLGFIFANVPTAPEIAQVDTSSIASTNLFLFLLNSS